MGWGGWSDACIGLASLIARARRAPAVRPAGAWPVRRIAETPGRRRVFRPAGLVAGPQGHLRRRLATGNGQLRESEFAPGLVRGPGSRRPAAGLRGAGYDPPAELRSLCRRAGTPVATLSARYPAPAGLARTSPNPPAGPIKPPASGVSAMARRTHASASGCRGRPPRVAGAAAFFLAMAAACQFAPSMGNPAQGKPGATAECRACGAWQPVMGGGGEP